MSVVGFQETSQQDDPLMSDPGFLRRFLTTALEREIVRRALRMSALIGTVLALINHGPVLFTGNMESQRWIQIGLTYMVPYCVATYAATMQELRHKAAIKALVSRAERLGVCGAAAD
jgi:hypothetical protein